MALLGGTLFLEALAGGHIRVVFKPNRETTECHPLLATDTDALRNDLECFWGIPAAAAEAIIRKLDLASCTELSVAADELAIAKLFR
jgi:hypothetical protein